MERALHPTMGNRMQFWDEGEIRRAPTDREGLSGGAAGLSGLHDFAGRLEITQFC
jgi:hypothetical protein